MPPVVRLVDPPEECRPRHLGAVMTVLFVVLGVDLVSKGLSPLGR